MSWDFRLRDPITKKTIILDSPHNMRGGTYQMGGTQEAWLNITYNYGDIYRKYIDATSGINILQDKTGAESIPILMAAIDKMGDDVSGNYWEPTEGNAKRALHGLLALARLRPDGVWDIS